MSQYGDQGGADDSMGGQDQSADPQGQGQGQSQSQSQSQGQGQGQAQGGGRFPNPDIAEQYYHKAVGGNAAQAAGGMNGGPDAQGNTGSGQSDDGSMDGANGAMTTMGAAGGVGPSTALDVHGHPQDTGITKGPHGHDVYAAHLPHWTHQRATEHLGQVVEHGWDQSHTKAFGHLSTYAFSAFGRYMGFC